MQFQYLPINTACKLRKDFISKNISGSSQSYRYSMCHGDFYGTGSHRPCMWESFDSYTVISRKAALQLLSEMPTVYITWDTNSTKLSRKLQKSRMVSAKGAHVALAIENCGGYSFRPSNFYCISEDISHCVVFTNVTINGIGDICLTTVKNPKYTGVPESYKELFECYRNNPNPNQP